MKLFAQTTILLLSVGFLVLLGIVGMTIWLGERAQLSFNDVIAARDVRFAAGELRNAFVTAESSERGFLLTGNEIYLAPFEIARVQAERQLAELTRLLKAGAAAQTVVPRLTAIIAEKFAQLDATIVLKRERRDAEALDLFRTNRGKALTDEANVFFSGIIRAADERMTAEVAEQNINATRLRWASITGGLVILGVVGVAFAAVWSKSRAIAAARDEVALLNESLERRVDERTADLANANDEIQRFAYIVTHDLRAPLVNIMGFTSELEAGLGSVKALVNQADSVGRLQDEALTAVEYDLPEAIGFIKASTKKMDSLINAILKLSREGRRRLNPERVDLGEVIEASSAAVQHQLTEAGGQIDVTLVIQSIISDRLSLEQIFANLLDNAVKYRSSKRYLRIGIRVGPGPRGEGADIEVADNGRGIAETDLERIFELFRRSGAQDQRGEGIGLAHVQALVRNLGGEISVTSGLESGTTFRIILPGQLPVERSSAA